MLFSVNLTSRACFFVQTIIYLSLYHDLSFGERSQKPYSHAKDRQPNAREDFFQNQYQQSPKANYIVPTP